MAEAEALFARFHDLVTGRAGDADAGRELGKLARLRRRRRVPGAREVRHPGLAHARAALDGKDEPVSTE